MALFHEFLGDIRFGFRRLGKYPLPAAVAIFTLVLGLGANIAAFCYVNAAFLRPLPYRDSSELVVVSEFNGKVSSAAMKSSWPNLEDWRRQTQSILRLAGYRDQRFTVTGSGGPERADGQAVTPEFFAVLSVPPALGRTIAAEDEIVLSHGYWERRFAADPAVLGKPMDVDARSYRIVGVMPPGFRLVQKAEFWLPLAVHPTMKTMRGARYVYVVGRLQPGVRRTEAQAALDVVARNLAQAYPDSNAGWGISVVSLQDVLLGSFRQRVLSLSFAAGLILLIACTNLGCLQLAQAEARKRELVIRTALGAGRGRLARQLIVEGLVIAAIGTALATAVASGFLGLLPLLGPVALSAPVDIVLDWRAVLYGIALTVLSSTLFGLCPAWRIPRQDLAAKMQGRSDSGTAPSTRLHVWGLLIVAEISLAQVLLVASGLTMHSFLNLSSIDPGFRAEGLLTVRVPLPLSRYAEGYSQARFFNELEQRARNLSGVRSVALASTVPFANLDPKSEFGVAGRPDSNASYWASTRAVTPDYFHTMAIAVLAGRTFSGYDTGSRPRAIVISKTMAESAFGRESGPARYLGRSLCWDTCDLTVVGVVGDVRHAQLQEKGGSTVYFPMPQLPQSTMTLILRTDSEPKDVAGGVQSIVRSLDADQPVEPIQRLQELVRLSMSQPIFSAGMLALFAALGVAMVLGGVYGVASYVVALRTHEIGVRMALGAGMWQVLLPLLRWGAAAASMGVLAGWAGSFLFARLLGSLLYSVGSADVTTLAASTVAIWAVVLVACWVPARRAVQIDPVEALRGE